MKTLLKRLATFWISGTSVDRCFLRICAFGVVVAGTASNGGLLELALGLIPELTLELASEMGREQTAQDCHNKQLHSA